LKKVKFVSEQIIIRNGKNIQKEVLRGEGMFKFNDEKGQLKCSFCGKTQDQVRKLVAGPGVYICDECIELCTEIVEEELGTEEEVEFKDVPKPAEIRDILNEYVIGQDQAKKALSTGNPCGLGSICHWSGYRKKDLVGCSV